MVSTVATRKDSVQVEVDLTEKLHAHSGGGSFS